MTSQESSIRNKAECRGYTLHKISGTPQGIRWLLYREGSRHLAAESSRLEAINNFMDQALVDAVVGLPKSTAFKEALEFLQYV